MLKITIPNVREIKAALIERIEKVVPKNPKGLTVGIHDSAGDHSEKGIKLSVMGAKNHFGFQVKPNVFAPPRPWLDVGAEKGLKKYEKVVKTIVRNGGSLDDALKLVAVHAQASVQRYATDLKDPPNAPMTIKEKGFDDPLIDTGEMINSVTTKIVNTLPEEG